MALENKLKRLVLLMEPDIQRMLEKQAQRAVGYDDVRWDERAGYASFLRGGGVLWQPRAEKIGEWSAELAMFRWWWTGIRFGEHGRTRLDAAYREGERYGLSELTTDPVAIDALDDAEALARLAAQLSRADGVVRLQRGDRVTFVALFDAKGESTRPSELAESRLRDTAVTRPSQRPSWIASDPLEQPTDRPAPFVPAAIGAPPPMAGRRPFSVAPPPHAGMDDPRGARGALGVRSIPPVRPIDVSPDDLEEPQIPAPPRLPSHTPTPPPLVVSRAPIREPSRETFMPVAQAALGDVTSTVPGFGQALVVVRVEVDAHGKGRFFVQLVAANAAGDLTPVDPSRALLDAVAKLIADDARDGNGRWRRLSARLRPTPRGASVDLEVV